MGQLRLRLIALALFTAVLALALAGCSGNVAATTPPPSTPTPTPSVTLSSSNATINAGDAVTLTWSAANATSVSITPDAGVPAPLPMQGTAQVKPAATTTYTITASGAGGSTTASTTITVNAAQPAPTATISITPGTITAGSLATLTWATTNATSVVINPAIDIEDAESIPLNFTTQISPAQTTTYTITATGPGGTATSQATLTVNQVAPTVTLSLDNTTINPGQSATLTWSTTNATALTIDNGVTVADPAAGSFKVSPTTTTTCTATATGLGGTATQQITLNVSKFAASLTAAPTTILPGASATLTWSVTTDPGQSATISIDNNGGTNLAPTGTTMVKPTNTTTYTLTAKESNGETRTATATVIVNNGLQSVKHIIFMVQENRSFDNYFAKLGLYKASKGLPNDVDGINDDSTITLKDSAGVPVHPYHYQTVQTDNLTPSWDESHSDVNRQKDGTYKMDGFARIASKLNGVKFDPTGRRAMGHYDQTDLPYYYELATQFAVSDRMFSPLLANTIPNRTFLFTGTTRGMVYQDQPSATDAFNQPTIFDKLQAAGVSWRYYYMDSSVFLASFPNSWGTADNPNLTMQGHVRNINELFTFLADPNADKLLPQVIFIERGSQTGLDEHPDNNIQPGAAKVASIVNALMQSKAWPTSVFFLTFDEAGGLYDHVPPMQTVAPDDIPVDHTPTHAGTQVNPGDFTESGMRLPFIAVSPFVKPHYVSHVPRDTTAILKFIETRFAVTPLTRRDAAQDDMTEMFDFSNPVWLVPPASVLNTVQPTNGVAKPSLETAGSQ